ncbi:YppG family protein [Geobacillus subterraneus]|uniref:YppG family protein n=1 Tax=Geobacillus subterraneus TaxID=129338 RepID=UPI0016073DCA
MYRYPRPVSPPPVHGPYSLGGHWPYYDHWPSYIPSAPAHWSYASPFHVAMPSHPTPYPKPGPLLPPPRPSFLAQFKNNDGTYDINKMMSTMGQMINTVNQVNGMLKGLLSTFKK